MQSQFLSTDENQTKPTLLVEIHRGSLIDDETLKIIQDEFNTNKDAFVRKTFQRFFLRAKKILYGSLSDKTEFCRLVEERVCARRDWVVHAKIPLQVGGSSDYGNMVLMLSETQAKFEADVEAQLFAQRFHETAARTIRLSIPAYPLYLPCAEGKLRLPILSDNNQKRELELPLDKYSRTQLSDQGFGSLRKKIIGSGRPRLSREDMEEVEDSVRQSDGYLGRNNRIQRQHRQFNHRIIKYG